MLSSHFASFLDEFAGSGPVVLGPGRVVVTADALHTQRGHATCLRSRGAHYVLTVKGKQPGLLAQLETLP